MEYRYTLTSAKKMAEQGELEEWIHGYLLSEEGHNVPFSDGLKLFKRYYVGPVNAPLSLFKRCCGPEENMKYRVHPVVFENKVNALMQAYSDGADLPPLIINYTGSTFELNDGNHRFEALTRFGVDKFSVIFWITEQEHLQSFKEKYPEFTA